MEKRQTLRRNLAAVGSAVFLIAVTACGVGNNKNSVSDSPTDVIAQQPSKMARYAIVTTQKPGVKIETKQLCSGDLFAIVAAYLPRCDTPATFKPEEKYRMPAGKTTLSQCYYSDTSKSQVKVMEVPDDLRDTDYQAYSDLIDTFKMNVVKDPKTVVDDTICVTSLAASESWFNWLEVGDEVEMSA